MWEGAGNAGDCWVIANKALLPLDEIIMPMDKEKALTLLEMFSTAATCAANVTLVVADGGGGTGAVVDADNAGATCTAGFAWVIAAGGDQGAGIAWGSWGGRGQGANVAYARLVVEGAARGNHSAAIFLWSLASNYSNNNDY